jgi:Protein of unknown function (DUF3300)
MIGGGARRRVDAGERVRAMLPVRERPTMQRTLVVPLLLASIALIPSALAQEAPPEELFSPDQLDNLLAPVALYPDPLLAQVLVAATFPDQIDDAARFVRADSDPADIDEQPWDVSVQAVAHYPTVLAFMDDNLDWTTSLGQAYVDQSVDVMASVQRLRAQAQAAGNLVSSSEMEVVTSGGEIELWPAQAQLLYVPEYDPALVYFSPDHVDFGIAFAIGAWLDYDFDWPRHRVYYHGWDRSDGWIARSRPFIHRTPAYVGPSHRTVVVNRQVVRRTVDYSALDRYNNMRREVRFKPPGGAKPVAGPPPISNKIIRRNIDTNDPRLREYRGHPTQPAHVEPPAGGAFTPPAGGFSLRESSTRGKESRAQAARPPVRAPRGKKRD